VKKYLVIPDYVKSKNDGQKHYITAKELIRLYGVNPKECVIYDPSKRQHTSNLIPLGPLFSGKYEEYIEKLRKV
jgi:hypothetical protein